MRFLPRYSIYKLILFLTLQIRHFIKWTRLKFLKKANAKAANNAILRIQSKKVRKNANIVERLLKS
jgi:hypothetical protein